MASVAQSVQSIGLEIQGPRFNSQPGFGVAFFTTGPGWILKCIIFLTLKFALLLKTIYLLINQPIIIYMFIQTFKLLF